MVTTLIRDSYLLGFAPTQRLLWSQILCRLYRNSSDKTVN